jgi:two-component system sensor histidine kinase KdpD
VFINLLENAAKYAGAGATLHIQVRDHPTYAQVTVSDNGCGIPEKDLPHIFEKFYKGPQGGLGLGLPICRAIIAVHGGRMWAEHNPTGGVSFHCTLPRAQDDASAQTAVEAT